MTGYPLPVAADVFYKMFAVPDAAILVGAVGTKGYKVFQENSRRVALLMQNRGAGSVVFVSENENGFANAIALEPNDRWVLWPYPPRNALFAWKTGASDFRYSEGILQPYRQSVSGDVIRSNVQSF